MKPLYAELFLGVGLVMAIENVKGQCIVSQNSQGQLVTTCTVTESRGTTVVQKLYLGSEFLNFPIWQFGSVDIDGNSKGQPCEIAFNVSRDEVSYRLSSDTTRIITGHPVAFTINGAKFSSQPYNVLGIKQRIYFMHLYEGKVKLLRHTKCTLKQSADTNNGYNIAKQDSYVGYYEMIDEYYIQQKYKPLQKVSLTKKSLLRSLGDNAKELEARIPKGQLTVNQVVNLLAHYDGLSTQ
ncbi:hypothetical protein [Spirosoma endbachense]|uniref:Uncharacterized protein n=1 Tax=Spirosoma endbachense TaxID=2666025 RepID=A0A6P1VZS5_9BACT|nr:hypothetical protein [Spirosoma endbachense]QHV97582.1 hypothetical protein GJR95_22360 [Spirosoma endbachense]